MQLVKKFWCKAFNHILQRNITVIANNGKCSLYLLVTSAWYVIYKIQRSTFRLCKVAEMQSSIFNLHISKVSF